MIIIGIESSCDETAVAVVKDKKEVLSSVVASQIDVHTEFGGVVPEVASRIHVENISYCIEKALKDANITMEDVDAVAVTQGPGLIGCLHVGVQAAKTLAFAYHKPLVPVHHLAGHIYANELVVDMKYPVLALVVSGGNTELVYMKDETSFEILGETQMMRLEKPLIRWLVCWVLDILVVLKLINWQKKVSRYMNWQNRRHKVVMILVFLD